MYNKQSKNSKDPDQPASNQKPADLDLHCFQYGINPSLGRICLTNLSRKINI